jgi:hypothetical protein
MCFMQIHRFSKSSEHSWILVSAEGLEPILHLYQEAAMTSFCCISYSNSNMNQPQFQCISTFQSIVLEKPQNHINVLFVVLEFELRPLHL